MTQGSSHNFSDAPSDLFYNLHNFPLVKDNNNEITLLSGNIVSILAVTQKSKKIITNYLLDGSCD